MKRVAVVLAVLLVIVACAPEANWAPPDGASEAAYPGEAWQKAAAPEELGWSSEKLAAARAYSEKIGSAAVMIVDDGIVVDAWGDTSQRFACHSMRKSLLSALIGIHVDEGHMDLSKTLAELGIDDAEPSLTAIEKQATAADLIKARSGIYHVALGEAASMKAARPERHSHAPGTFWYYNNWDFNALGTIFEQETGTRIFEEFDRRIAQPLQMEDFRVSDGRYETGPDSIHPVYSFRMSTRDLARFGLLFLREGRWRDQQVIPADWVRESTATHSEIGPDSGYGYMWWTGVEGGLFPNVRVKEHSFFASGYRGQRVIVLPYRNLVIVHRVDTDSSSVDIGNREIGPLLWLILDAAGEAEIGDAPIIEAAEGIQVTADNVHETWGESTIWHLNGPEGQYITSYAPDGTMTFTATESGELVDTGKWWAEGDRVCRQWKEMDGGEKACFYVVLDGTTLRQFDLEGIAVGKVSFSRGASQALTSRSCGDSDARHCTILTVSQGDRVFFGGNDDYINRDSVYWVDPGSDTRYGAIYFGERDNVQQGFNEKGLAYDSNGLPLAPVTAHPGRQPVYGGYTSYPIQILRACATVEEVIAWVQEHQWHQAMHDQLHFADATGDAVVISAGPDGQVAFTRKPAGDGFLVSTNFNVANPSNGGYPCWRYSRAEEMLSEIQDQDDLTVERVASIMEAVHVEGPSGWTLYSVVADLRQRLVYVYFMFQYDAPIVLSVDEQIARTHPSRPLSELFPEETQRRADQAYQWLMARQARCNTVGFIWLGLVVASLVVLLLVVRPGHRGLAFWALVVAVLGPVGLLIFVITGRGRRAGILLEAAGDLPPIVIGIVVALLTIVLLHSISQNRLLQLFAFYGIPLIIGLFLYQAPLLARATGSSYARAVWRRLPAVLVSSNLALAGLLATNLLLINVHLNYCGFSGLAVLQWWAIVALSAWAGGLLLCAYHAWAVRRGFAAWSGLLWDTGNTGGGTTAVSSPSWRRLWPWILLSFVILVAGIVLEVVGTTLTAGLG